MAEEFRAKYDDLEKVATQFSKQSEAINSMQQKLKASMSSLKSGWIGVGSDAFFAEMEQTVLPASNRLKEVLGAASAVTKQISQLSRTAEEEASSRFRTQ